VRCLLFTKNTFGLNPIEFKLIKRKAEDAPQENNGYKRVAQAANSQSDAIAAFHYGADLAPEFLYKHLKVLT
jgi:hypothetical protein